MQSHPAVRLSPIPKSESENGQGPGGFCQKRYTAILCRRMSSPSTLRAPDACTLRLRVSTLPHAPVRRPPNSASACVPSLSSSSSGSAYARDFLRFVVPDSAYSGSASAVFDEDDREERGGGSSCAAEVDERLDVPGGGGTGSGLRIFLQNHYREVYCT